MPGQLALLLPKLATRKRLQEEKEASKAAVNSRRKPRKLQSLLLQQLMRMISTHSQMMLKPMLQLPRQSRKSKRKPRERRRRLHL